MPITGQRPLQPGSLAVNRRARGKDRKEEVEQSWEDAARDAPVGQKEGAELVWRGGKFIWHGSACDEGRKHQRQHPCVAIFHA